MSKRKVIKAVDLSDWNLPKTSAMLEKKIEKVSDRIEKIIDELRFGDSEFENIVKEAAAETITYALENYAHLSFSKEPKKKIEVIFCLPLGSDYADYAEWKVNFNEEIYHFIYTQTRTGKFSNPKSEEVLTSMRKSFMDIVCEIDASLKKIEETKKEKNV